MDTWRCGISFSPLLKTELTNINKTNTPLEWPRDITDDVLPQMHDSILKDFTILGTTAKQQIHKPDNVNLTTYVNH